MISTNQEKVVNNFVQEAMKQMAEINKIKDQIADIMNRTREAAAEAARKVIEGAQQMRASSALELALAHVLGIGNAMNERTARGDAGGFGLEVLSSLMGVKAASGHSTMMHYLAEVLAQHGVSAAAVRSELRRAADAASIDLGDVTLEVERLVASVATLHEECERCATELLGGAAVASRRPMMQPALTSMTTTSLLAGHGRCQRCPCRRIRPSPSCPTTIPSSRRPCSSLLS